MNNTSFFSIFLVSLYFTIPAYATSWWNLSPSEVRDRINQRIMEIDAPEYPVFNVIDKTIQHENRTTPIRIYFPNENKNLPIILMIHGGAFVAGNLDTHDNLAKFLCSQTERLVVSVGYTNAPEEKFPFQLNQCSDVLNWIVSHAHEFDANPQKIAIVGDSAGGNLTAALCLKSRDNNGPKINLQILINPALDLSNPHPEMKWVVNQYLTNENETQDPYVSPLYAQNLEELPETLIITAELDELRFDGEEYAKKLLDSNIRTILYCQQGIGHLAGHGARASSSAKESLDEVVKFILKFNAK